MINYEDIRLEQIDYIKAIVICDGDKKQVIIEEGEEDE